MVEPTDRSARRAPDLAPRHRSRCAQGPLSAPPVRTTSPTSSAAACATCCSAAAPRTSTSARRRIRYQVKKLFRNCWIIGRRFRLAHVKFGTEGDRGRDVPAAGRRRRGSRPGRRPAPDPRSDAREGEHLIHHDNTFGTPEEDAFRRDFTINALFYDIATFSVIDYVNGLDDLDAPASCDRSAIPTCGSTRIRCGCCARSRSPRASTSRSSRRVLDAIRLHRHEIARSSPPRLLEEYYKILRSGYAEKAMRQLRVTGLMKEITSELAAASEALWRSIAALDRPRNRFASAARVFHQRDSCRNPAVPDGPDRRQRFPPTRSSARWSSACSRSPGETSNVCSRSSPSSRVLDIEAPVRAQRGILHRAILDEALTWLEIHGDRPGRAVAHWQELKAQAATQLPQTQDAAAGHAPDAPFRRRRRRRRRRGNYGARS